jgi:hypothetical protein
LKDTKLEKRYIIFNSNKNNATLIKASINDSAESIISTLQFGSLKPKSIFLVFGGASDNLDTSDTSITKIHQILDNILQYASNTNAIIIDGGTKSGIMEIVGRRVSHIEQSQKPIILGVAPEGLISFHEDTKYESDGRNVDDKVFLDPNHSYFVLVEGNKWGDETQKLFEIAIKLAHDDATVVAFLLGGGEISKKEMLFCIDQKWSIIVIEKTGFLADQIANYKNQKQNLGKILSDSEMKSIISSPCLKLFPSDSNKKSFRQFLLHILNYSSLFERK